MDTLFEAVWDRQTILPARKPVRLAGPIGVGAWRGWPKAMRRVG
jgi:hypothetical protein